MVWWSQQHDYGVGLISKYPRCHSVLEKQVWSMEAQTHIQMNFRDLQQTSCCQVPQTTFRYLEESNPRQAMIFYQQKGDFHAL